MKKSDEMRKIQTTMILFHSLIIFFCIYPYFSDFTRILSEMILKSRLGVIFGTGNLGIIKMKFTVINETSHILEKTLTVSKTWIQNYVCQLYGKIKFFLFYYAKVNFTF